jgi:cold shock CspA family protein
MRYQGRITDWKDDRGFGFITPNGGGATVFVHISAFEKGQPRPTGNELVTYELGIDEKKAQRAQNVMYVGSRPAAAPGERRTGFGPVVAALVVAGLGVYGWQNHSSSRIESSRIEPVLDREPEFTFERQPSAVFSCEGKQHCTEMTSCEEARFYLRNCPGVKIDGDNDGIPCEDQWCPY